LLYRSFQCFGFKHPRAQFQKSGLDEGHSFTLGSLFSNTNFFSDLGCRLGACGGENGNNDLITAIGKPLFQSVNDNGNSNNNPFCGNKILVQHGTARSWDAGLTRKQGVKALKLRLLTNVKLVLGTILT
jgi:hypothetical protein